VLLKPTPGRFARRRGAASAYVSIRHSSRQHTSQHSAAYAAVSIYVSIPARRRGAWSTPQARMLRMLTYADVCWRIPARRRGAWSTPQASRALLPRRRAPARSVCEQHVQHTSAYVSLRQNTSAYVSIRQHASAYVSMRQHASAYVSISQHKSAHAAASMREHTCASHARRTRSTNCGRRVPLRQHTSAYVSIRQHASAYVSMRRTNCGRRDPLHTASLVLLVQIYWHKSTNTDAATGRGRCMRGIPAHCQLTNRLNRRHHTPGTHTSTPLPSLRA
jgi:hypothetical protein